MQIKEGDILRDSDDGLYAVIIKIIGPNAWGVWRLTQDKISSVANHDGHGIGGMMFCSKSSPRNELSRVGRLDRAELKELKSKALITIKGGAIY